MPLCCVSLIDNTKFIPASCFRIFNIVATIELEAIYCSFYKHYHFASYTLGFLYYRHFTLSLIFNILQHIFAIAIENEIFILRIFFYCSLQ